MEVTRKKRGYELQLATKKGKNGDTYLFIKDYGGSYHAFIEVEAKAALKDCGAEGGGNTRQRGKRLLGF